MMIMRSRADAAVNAVIGSAGLLPTLDIIDAGIPLALANKESLVIAGDLVMKRAADRNVRITPVDSEHSAVFQCLAAGRREDIYKIIITASGGPFFGRKRDELASVTPEMALAHPTWKMGPSITVDSATLMNKGFEVIEASKLFSLPADSIDVHRSQLRDRLRREERLLQGVRKGTSQNDNRREPGERRGSHGLQIRR